MAAKTFQVATANISAPITALSFLNPDTIVAGEGSFLKVFCCTTTCLLASQKTFLDARIHNLKVIAKPGTQNPTLYIVFGGKTIRLVEVSRKDDNVLINCVSEEKRFGSWIWDAVLLGPGGRDPDCDSQLLALVSSQNNVFLWNWKDNNIFKVSNCAEQCILYSAAFWGQDISDLTVAVGTVFNEVLIWKPFEDDTSLQDIATTNKLVAKRLTGHEGVIFAVVFKQDGDQLLSVSDDRSIRLWDLETSGCLRVLYGHKARVWSAAFFNDHLVSIGEDAACILWDAEGSIVKKYNGHKGKSIWSLDVDAVSKSIVTGGGDGGIRLWSADKMLGNHSYSVTDASLPSDDITSYRAQSSQCDVAMREDDFPRTVRLLSTKEALIMTNNGCLLQYTSNCFNKPSGQWKMLLCDTNYSSYCCVDVDRDLRLAALGSLNGLIKIIHIDLCISTEINAFEGKTLSIFILNNSKNFGPVKKAREPYVIASGPGGKILVWKIMIDKESIEVNRMGTFQLPYCRQRWAAAIAMIDSGFICGKNSVLKFGFIIGDRRGSVHVFHGANNNAEELKGPSQSLLSVHGKTGVTSVITVGEYVYTSGRDGVYRKFKINSDLLIEPLDRKKVCKGMDWIEGLMMTADDILVYGFYMQSYFAIWSSIRNEMILKIQCGGGYRSWDFYMPSLGEKPSAFIYLKGPVIKSCVVPVVSNQRVIKEGLHGREINCIEILGKIKIKDEMRALFATGSEDTLVHFVTYSFKRNAFERIHTIEGHIGSVKSIGFIVENTASSPAGYELQNRKSSTEIHYKTPYLLFTCGSRTSLKCTRVYFQDDGHVNSCLLAEIGTPINSLKSKSKIADLSDADDLRFISLAVFPAVCDTKRLPSADVYCIAAACSDGVLRFYGFSSSKRRFVLLTSSGYHSRCVQIVRHFCISIGSFVQHFVLSGGTDGRIALWDLTETVQECEKNILSGNEIENDWSRDLPETFANQDNFINLNHDEDAEGNSSEPVKAPLEINPTKCTSYFLSSNLHSAPALDNVSLRPFHVFHAHQSGIHSIDVIESEADSSFIVASGGDDNALFSSKFKICRSSGGVLFSELWTHKNAFAHHSTITGVTLLSEEILMTCSVDQRLKIWRPNPKEQTTDSFWTIAFTCFTDIADVSDLRAWIESEKIHTVISGVGMEIKEIRCK